MILTRVKQVCSVNFTTNSDKTSKNRFLLHVIVKANVFLGFVGVCREKGSSY